MAEDQGGHEVGVVTENSNLISLDQFREKLKEKKERAIIVTPKEPAQAIYDELLKLVRYLRGVRNAHDALLDIVLMQSRFMDKVLNDREMEEYLALLRPLQDQYFQKAADYESIE